MQTMDPVKNIFSLSEVMDNIRRTIAEKFTAPFWIKAEMNKLNHYVHSGHCYPELLEKKDGKVVAQVRANLWKDDYRRVNENFRSVVKEPLKDGINILFLGKVNFDAVYGLSLRIFDIDPSYSLGELEREKQETIERLQREDIFHENKKLPLAMVPKRIAVISVETSKGFADFRQVIDHNAWGYRFFYLLFPSLLQGDKLAESIGYQLDRIRKVRHHFDCVAIIRGGGGDIGLAGYNHYDLARQIALFPLPVITGIGHATNETVSEMVAFRNFITPTDLAGFLIQQFHNFAVPVREAGRIVSERATFLIKNAETNLYNKATLLSRKVLQFLSVAGRDIEQHKHLLRMAAGQVVDSNRLRTTQLQTSVKKEPFLQIKELHTHLNSLERQVRLLDPVHTLARGYTITRVNGRSILGVHPINLGDLLQTITLNGEISSQVLETQTQERTPAEDE
jgi:exodeoxyribonuclease VII large subunit